MEGAEGGRADWERRKRWTRTGRKARGVELKEQSGSEADGEQDEARASGAERGPERSPEGETEKRGSISHIFLSRMLINSSASSSSSSFTYTSDESDDVFSEKEDTATRRQNMRKSHSWKTFITMIQWPMRKQSSWVQLAGHQDNFQPSEGGEVLKRYNAVENSCLQALMKDSLRQFVPSYYGLTSRGSESYIRLEDLLSGLACPVIMDCKMGIRTYLEEELARARSSPCLRADMYQKMVKVDPTAPSAEEHTQAGVTKPRYMQWRDSMSSTSTLGFRIEGITGEDGRILRDFKKTRSLDQVTDALLSFTKRRSHILEAYLSRLHALSEALKESEFFNTHEIIGSSLLFVHDRTDKANIWMIDFAKTTPLPSGVHLKHDVPWVEGNREDGYIIGLSTLTSLMKEALQALGQYQDERNTPAQADRQTGTQGGAQTGDAVRDHV
ncbi:inositol-trisphosphate 3-kinase B [Conger conger]|uniref:inositol-trisphosphate 3-kinase B n=1 Tax=Conger conger TaxID=82655 RepID=UPI002A5AE883|nr:inositol-trisphosphate 3-kinase B [Conger conger]